jgi:leucine-rich repeat protein SHOC2
MRLLALVLTAFLLGCTPTEKKNGLFDNLLDKETAVIYLSEYNLDSVPSEIGRLKKVKSLYITKDITGDWAIYPPLSEIQRMMEIPPFRQLPKELGELSSLRNLGLVGLDLKQLPNNFGQLQQLDSLNLTMNKLTISEEIGKLKDLKNLKYLALFGNKVDSTDISELRKVNPDLVLVLD